MKKFFYFIYAFLSLIITTSCSQMEEPISPTCSITIDGEEFNLDRYRSARFIKYGDDGSTYSDILGEYNYSIDFEGETSDKYYSFELNFLAGTMPKKGSNLTKYNLRGNINGYQYKYKSGKLTVSDKDEVDIRIKFDNLVMELIEEGPDYLSETQTINGSITLSISHE